MLPLAVMAVILCGVLALAPAAVSQSVARPPDELGASDWPGIEQAYLKASNTNAMDYFGFSVSVSGDTAVVGAYREDSDATGVDGNQANNNAAESGAVYVFVRSGTSWSQQAYLKASNAEAGDGFGSSVSVSGDTLVVGAPGEESAATGVNGDQSDNSFTLAGAAYVFVRSGESWSQQAYLKASNTDPGDDFGKAVSVSGDTVVIGADLEDSNATGVNGDQSNDSTTFSGAAYVFVRSGTSWSQQAYLKASNTGATDTFGLSVAVSGDTVVVGAYREASDATGVNGNQNDNSSIYAGAAYVFGRNGTHWSQEAYLKASNTDANDDFGVSVAVSGDTVVVGAPGEASNAAGVNGDQGIDHFPATGAAYVFVRHATSWSQQAYLKASNPGAFDQFGQSVSVAGDIVVVGATWETSDAPGGSGDRSNDPAADAGASYAFGRNGTNWSPQAYLKASNAGDHDRFGISVSVSGDTAVIGAFLEDSNATGVNGTGTDPSVVFNSGAAYILDFGFGDWTDLGSGLGGTSGVPLLAGTGALSPNSSNHLDLTGANTSSAATLIVGLSPLNAPFKGGTLVPAPLLLVPLLTNAAGASGLPFTWPANVPAGTALYFQFWISDPAASAGLSASNGLKGVSG